jgi:hypothetical protein
MGHGRIPNYTLGLRTRHVYRCNNSIKKEEKQEKKKSTDSRQSPVEYTPLRSPTFHPANPEPNHPPPTDMRAGRTSALPRSSSHYATLHPHISLSFGSRKKRKRKSNTHIHTQNGPFRGRNQGNFPKRPVLRTYKPHISANGIAV